ncbi:PAS domain S-box-containing protein [Granulicella aggregans]|uniref:histidine kinase n=1 Tax=Granulicella aggregans TaxID=474949 RepID=A0A7W8E3Z7_9BACT|nr:PAS domain-containing protein [Granulicella aggregans]MBB5058503.1 PAS domain S-box-containing protein [Granulicella aggregans]
MENTGRFDRDVEEAGSRRAASSHIYGIGEMAEEIRSFAWETSPLGSIDKWSPTLLAVVNVVLSSPIPAAVYWGPQLIFICNDPSLRMMGAKPPAVLGLSVEALWGPFWSKVEQERFRSVMDSGQSFHGESVPYGFRRDGRSVDVFVNYSLSPIYEDGQVAGIFRTLEDISENVLAMRALAESDARLRMALSVNRCVGVWDWHLRDNVVFGDETIASLYGIDPKAAAAGAPHRAYERLLHPEDIDVLNNAVMACIATGKDFSVDYRVRQADDSYRWIQSRGRCVYDENGRPSRVTGLKLDITSEKNEAVTTLPRNLFPTSDPSSDLDSLPPSVTTFVAATANLLAEFPSEIELEVVPEAAGTQFILRVAKSDLGRLIGRQGRIIRSIRMLLYTAAATHKERFSIDVESKNAPAG